MRVIALLAALSLFSTSAETRWIVMRSSNFEVYSSEGERATRATLEHFEKVRGFFQQVMTVQTEASPFLIRVVVFDSRKDYEKVRLNEFATAFYKPGALREYIVMGDTATEVFPIAVHEYVHLLARQAGMNLPPWLSEGMAELYSTLEPQGNKIVVGRVIAGRWMALQQDKWVPLKTILGADRNSPYYNEKNKAGSLYNEGWALTHMLMLSNEYRAGLSEALSSIQAGKDSESALAEAYGKPLSEIEKDLQRYLRRQSLQAVVFDAKLEKLTVRPEPQPAADFDIRLILAEVAERPASADVARKTYEELRKDFPERPEPYALLGYQAWRAGAHQEAAELMGKAYQLGERSPKLLWDYGRLAQVNDTKGAATALEELMRLQPARNDVRVELASAKLRLNDAGGAMDALAPVKRVNAAEAPRLFETMALAQYQLGNKGEAKKSATRMAEFARDPETRTRAQRLMEYVDQAGGRWITPVTTPADGGDGEILDTRTGRPRVRRGMDEPSPQELINSPPPRAEVKGQLVSMDCEQDKPRLTIKVDGRNLVLLLDQPNQVELLGANVGGPIEFQCGPQKARLVRIEYQVADPMPPDLTGMVRLIEFLP